MRAWRAPRRVPPATKPRKRPRRAANEQTLTPVSRPRAAAPPRPSRRYRPLLLATDVEIKRTRVLLLLLPEEVIKSTPALVRAASRFASSSGG